MVDTIVSNFTCSLSNGLQFELFNTLKNGPVIIVFINKKWESKFNRHMKKLNEYIDRKNLRKKSTLVVISSLSVSGASKLKAQNHLNCLIGSDADQEIIEKFNVQFSDINSDIPFTVIINQNQKIAKILGQEKVAA